MRRRTWSSVVGAAVAFAMTLGIGTAQDRDGERRVGHAVRPETRKPTDELMQRLRVPNGFRVGVFADRLDNPRMMAIANDGTVYVTRPGRDDVLALRDRDGDGRAEERKTVLSDLDTAHGIAVYDGRLWVAGATKVLAAELRENGTVGEWRTVIDDLPAGKGHSKRTIGFGPDGMLYVSVGSTCNACVEADEEHATILRARPDGRGREIFARGLRNTIGFTWHPETRELWGLDHGSDWRGDDQPPEELNRIVQGRHYGWPYCFGDRQPDPLFRDAPRGTTKEAFCGRTTGPVLTYQAHSAPIGMTFYTGAQFPAEYRDDAFAAMRGSWNRKPPTGYKVIRIRFERGQPARFEDFLSGFLIENGAAHFGRPAGVAVAKDGALLVSEDTNGIIYRVYRVSANSSRRARG